MAESKHEPVKIHIDPHRLGTILGIITNVSTGESSPTFLEERVRELQEHVPFVTTALTLVGEAMDRLSKVKDKDVANDPSAIKEFLFHNDMLNRAQGMLAALLCVGESLRTDERRAPQGIPKIKSSPQKSRKGRRDVRKREPG